MEDSDPPNVGAEPNSGLLVHIEDLTKSKLIIALKEAEHRAMMADLFPDWEDVVEYWHVHDLDCAEPEEALPILEKHVQDLVDRLARQ